MNFEEAMAQVETGRKVRKAGWPASGYLKKGENGLVNDAGKPYEPTSVDRNMTDWSVSEVPDSDKAEAPSSTNQGKATADDDAEDSEAKPAGKPQLQQQRKRA
jgi:hypothetical protein